MITFNVNYNIIIIIILLSLWNPYLIILWNTKLDMIFAVLNFSSSSEMKAWKIQSSNIQLFKEMWKEEKYSLYQISSVLNLCCLL